MPTMLLTFWARLLRLSCAHRQHQTKGFTPPHFSQIRNTTSVGRKALQIQNNK